MSNSIYSDSKWLKERLYFQWQIIRRHPEYQKFCEDYCKYFTKDEFPSLDDSRLPDDTAKKKAENLRNRLGLNNVYHYKADIPKEYMLDWPIFEQDRAVECE